MNKNDNESLTYQLPLLALRGITVFPNVMFHFDVGRSRSAKALEKAMNDGQRVFLVTQKDIKTDNPEIDDLYKTGTVAKIRQMLRIAPDSIRVLVEGEKRARLNEITMTDPYIEASITEIDGESLQAVTKRDIALVRNAQELFLEYTELAPKMSGEVLLNVMDSDDLGHIADYIAQNIQLKYTDKQKILEQADPRKRIALLIKILNQEIEIMSIELEIQSKVKDQIDKNQRDYFLREQVKAINEELGDDDDTRSESDRYIKKIRALKLVPEIEEKLIKEAARLSKMQASSPESGVIRTYLDTCLELPWNKTTKENGDIARASKILDADHYGLKDVKERVLELFAVKNLHPDGIKGQIICLVGPPGVGKTSVARSIARSMGRNYCRLSLGGVRDEADIRGHRKTYIGAMPGRIITALTQAKSRNCVMLIDEIDKLGSDYKGDPSSALLEVFDTEQNVAFRDHFVEVPFDLSDVLFVVTANTMDTIPRPLLDRMEVIEVSGYTDEEKVQIAKRHLVPKQLKKHGLKKSNVPISDELLRTIINNYTRESGVRTLEREIAKLMRKTAKYLVETESTTLKVTPKTLHQYLGTPKYKREKLDKVIECGVVNGLAWTSVGGELLEVEVSAVDGTGKTELTGNLGDVMKESVKAALTYIRSRAEKLGIAKDFHSKKDLHVHFPEGAVPKDGPSAGIACASAMISALTGNPVPKTFAMTGEITLRGRVLPIGGLREKTMAAYRAGVKTVIIPEDNRSDLDDIDQTVRAGLLFLCVSHMDEVVKAVFTPEEQPPAQRIIDVSGVVLPREPVMSSIGTRLGQ